MAGWLVVTWQGSRPATHPRTLALMRTWLDRAAAAYDYATRMSDGTPQAAGMKREMLRTLPLYWDNIERSGLASDDVRIDWSIICLRVAQDGQARAWKNRAWTSLAQVAPAARDSDYYVLARAALSNTVPDDKPMAQLHQWLKVSPTSWSGRFLAWKLHAVPTVATFTVNQSGLTTYVQLLAARWYGWIMAGLGAVLLIPAWICLRKPFPRRKRSERLQKLWPLTLTLCLVFGTFFAVRLAMRYIADWMPGAAPWHSFVIAVGPQWAAVVWQCTIVALYGCIPWVTKAGLSAGWGSTWQVLGVEWKDFIKPRLLFTASAAACIYAACSLLLKPVSRLSGWGNPLLDMASRWPFSHDPEYNVFMLGYALVFAPLLEEVIHRGYLFAALRRRFNPGIAIAVTAVLFAADHAYSLSGTVSVLLAGVALGFVRHRTNRLAASILMHASINALVFADLAFLNFS